MEKAYSLTKRFVTQRLSLRIESAYIPDGNWLTRMACPSSALPAQTSYPSTFTILYGVAGEIPFRDNG